MISRVDVVVPCYNYARFLPQCVASALDQKGVEVRVLIIDDSSTDATDLVGKDLATRDSRVKYRRHVNNQGHIATYNEGLLGWCAAPYSILLSADDALAPGALARATALMDRHPDVGMTYGIALLIADGADLPNAGEPLPYDSHVLPGSRFLQLCCTRASNPVPTPTAVVRTALQKRLGGYRPSLPHAGDMEMWMRFAAHASLGVVRGIQAYYRIHDTNMSHRYYRQATLHHRQLLAACEAVLTTSTADWPDTPLWRRAVRKRLGDRLLRLASAALDQDDRDTFQECLECAAEIYPRLRHSHLWWRLRTRTFLGRHLWRGMRAARAVLWPGAGAEALMLGSPRNAPGTAIGCWPE